MKNRTIALLALLALVTVKASAFPVYMPPHNLVQNGNFQSGMADWSGNVPSFLYNWPSVPNNYAAQPIDIYQTLPTFWGQEYKISFYAAADLYLGPVADISVSLNNHTLTSFETPPYTYNPGINRVDQMHWEEYDFFFTASSFTKLEFSDLNGNFCLAAVSVTPVPDGGSTGWMLIAGLAMLCCCYPAVKVRHFH
jgi:hypothetical protein